MTRHAQDHARISFSGALWGVGGSRAFSRDFPFVLTLSKHESHFLSGLLGALHSVCGGLISV
jgi:hypothetical protein